LGAGGQRAGDGSDVATRDGGADQSRLDDPLLGVVLVDPRVRCGPFTVTVEPLWMASSATNPSWTRGVTDRRRPAEADGRHVPGQDVRGDLQARARSPADPAGVG